MLACIETFNLHTFECFYRCEKKLFFFFFCSSHTVYHFQHIIERITDHFQPFSENKNFFFSFSFFCNYSSMEKNNLNYILVF